MIGAVESPMTELALQPSLPDYANPPVVETILGVQFDRLPAFRNAHLGAYWMAIGGATEWPGVADAPPLQPQFEQFSKSGNWASGIDLRLSQSMAGRLQLKNAAGDRMIQVQNGRLHVNWIAQPGGAYPRYAAVREEFGKLLQRFRTFLAESRLGELVPNQWEVTYINHIPRGELWKSPNDWRFFAPLAGVPSIKGLVEGESFAGEWHFAIPDQRGRLHVNWQHGQKSEAPDDRTEFVRLTLTARGPLDRKANAEGIIEGLDLGHETVVCTFVALMTQEANEHWGLRSDAQ